MKAKNFFRKFFKSLSYYFVIIAILISFGLTVPTFAKGGDLHLPKGRETEFAENNIIFYNPEGDQDEDCEHSRLPSGSEITWIGDSYTAGANSNITSVFGSEIDLDYAVGRHWSEGIDIAKNKVESGELREYLVFALGTNDGGAQNISELVEITGEDTKIVLTTAYTSSNPSRYTEHNKSVLDARGTYGNISVADWASVASDDDYSDDGVHLSDYTKWVNTIKSNITTGGSGSGTGTGSNQNYAGDQVWTDAELAAVTENQPFYEKAASKYNFPWQLLAVFHRQEHALLRDNPANGQGAYQLYSYTDGGTNENAFLPPGPITDEEFQRQSDIAASVVSGKIAGRNINDDNVVKRVFFEYNGASSQYIDKAKKMGFSDEEANRGEGSPYVMNRYDAKRDPSSSEMSPDWPGRFTSDGKYDPTATQAGFGSYVYYLALGGSVNSCHNIGNGEIAETALLLSWPGLNSHPKDDPKPEYVAAMKEVGAYITPCNGSGCAPIGASCDQFVATVVRYSGHDSNYPVFGPDAQLAYVRSHPELYQKIEHNLDWNNLKSGDIFISDTGNTHTWIYMVIDGKPGQASASFNNRTGLHFNNWVYFDEGHVSYSVFRAVNGNMYNEDE